ncbi:helix-turn-helix domain-containing protein [Novosphingobium arvoryzae]|uniref:helix-turn-helix domain-containing protein n=1 Tax=Novosphingobium arvoryzae TaxID=1256514 RepID=UPI001E49FDB8|nr:helix-turn-helix domain-containing protein [Novosphingobium arvoryzae]
MSAPTFAEPDQGPLAGGRKVNPDASDGRTVKEAAELLAVHRSTLYRALARGEEVTKTEARRRGAFASMMNARKKAPRSSMATARPPTCRRRRIERRACRKSWRPSPMTSWRAGPVSWPTRRGSSQKTENKAR